MMLRRLALCSATALLSTAAPAAWHVAESDHFVVYADDSADDTRDYAQNLELFDAAVRASTGLKEESVSPANRVTVFLVDDLGDLRRLANAPANSGIAGFYQGRADGSYAFAPRRMDWSDKFALDANSVLQHEYAHHLMLGGYDGVLPPWLVEGWAEFFATVKKERDGSVQVGGQALYRAYTLTEGVQLSLKTMMGGGYDKLNGDQLESLYGRGWALTHYLMFQDLKKGPRAGQFTAYLRALNGGQTGLAAAEGAFGDLKLLERDLTRYTRARTLSAMSYKPGALSAGPVTVRPLKPGEAAILPVRMMSKRGVDEKTAPGIAVKARKVAAAYPDDPLVQASLAEAEFDAGRWDAALVAADRTVALDPTSSEGLIYQARARLAQLAKDGGDDRGWTAARAPLLAANRLENDDAEPLMLYYESFGQAGERPTANAVAGLMQAQRLVPQDAGLRLTATHQLLVDGDAAEARRMAGPIAFNPHGGALATLSRELVKRLDESGPEAALAFMDGSKDALYKAEDDEE